MARIKKPSVGLQVQKATPNLQIYRRLLLCEAKLLIEVDGESHLESDLKEYDKARTEYLEELGYKVIRFTNDDGRYSLQVVAEVILQTVENRIVELKFKK